VLRSNIPEYSVWHDMKQRCLNIKNKDFPQYGGRGISICDRWINSFDAFIDDIGERPTGVYSLDRIDNDGNYEPLNCKWSTGYEQATNRRVPSNRSGYVGVAWNKRKWQVQIKYRGTNHYLGVFSCKHKAAMVYDMFKETNNINPYTRSKK